MTILIEFFIEKKFKKFLKPFATKITLKSNTQFFQFCFNFTARQEETPGILRKLAALLRKLRR